MYDFYQENADPNRVQQKVLLPDDYATAKLAEMAVASILGVDASFIIGRGDGGHDLSAIINERPYTVDVKHTNSPTGDKLIWPKSRPYSKAADILTFVRVYPFGHEHQGIIDVFGWIPRHVFKRCAVVANGEYPRGIIKDTRFMPGETLIDIDILAAAAR
ncbi:MAG: hypothetical protein OXT06_17525 [Rhodospirillaceae bacterium]|nr:hypothetical protein [Rhodospirillaceae bacterium]